MPRRERPLDGHFLEHSSGLRQPRQNAHLFVALAAVLAVAPLASADQPQTVA
ncbi:hypothetical protein [Streptomyces sp. 4N124]|uniref:hypothetical protein n=1 Tax=Streptomyces sp. 4N124 TaxID=3457420 RepID=UPI003FCF5F99